MKVKKLRHGKKTITIDLKNINDFSQEEIKKLRLNIFMWNWCGYTEDKMQRKVNDLIRKIRKARPSHE